jgi:hypothetical protein
MKEQGFQAGINQNQKKKPGGYYSDPYPPPTTMVLKKIQITSSDIPMVLQRKLKEPF